MLRPLAPLVTLALAFSPRRGSPADAARAARPQCSLSSPRSPSLGARGGLSVCMSACPQCERSYHFPMCERAFRAAGGAPCVGGARGFRPPLRYGQKPRSLPAPLRAASALLLWVSTVVPPSYLRCNALP